MTDDTVLLWFRRDFRLDDNAALCAAVSTGKGIIPLFIWSPAEESPWPPGAAASVWMYHSLLELDAALAKKGVSLLIKSGNCLENLLQIARAYDLRQVFANSIYEPGWISRDKVLRQGLAEQGIEFRLFPGALLYDPFAFTTSQGKPFQVFTPFWKACMLRDPLPGKPLAEPDKISPPAVLPVGLKPGDLNLLPKIPWDRGIVESWRPGLNGARERLDSFLAEVLNDYASSRDLPGRQGTSRLSPYLHFGEISPRRVFHAVLENLDATNPLSKDAPKVQGMKARNAGEVYLRELGWREFAHQVLCNFPDTALQPLRSEFARFPWQNNEANLRAWQQGQTGYPIVDAGMRELWRTGWMHNRVRMIVASFLVKHLLLPWQAGARWFWDTLVDADLSNNTLGWQWSAGCGADAAPYFRIFNPILQAEKFDQEGTYVRRWVPELAKLPDEYIHKPWTAPRLILQGAGLEPGVNYPLPIVEHALARQRALEALRQLREGRRS